MEQGYAALERLASMAPRYDATVGQIALAWLLRKPEVSSVTFGVSRRAQLEENLGAADLRLSDADLLELDALTAPPD
jgi:aryl-alcohol dehydrogenase-like predicted oxidoreductase